MTSQHHLNVLAEFGIEEAYHVAPLASVVFVIVAGGALVASAFVFAIKQDNGPMLFPCFLLWLVSLGAIGSIACIGMNALSIQSDITFDLSNQRLMILRIVIGALFGLVFAIPLGIGPFLIFVRSVVEMTPIGDGELGTVLPLVAPFVLGFSTPLVITIMTRLVEAVQAFFGARGLTERSNAVSVVTARTGSLP
jgi:hypothetical protein